MGGQPGQLVQNVAGEENGDLVFPVQPQQQLANLHNPLGVQAVHRLVQHQKVGTSHQGHGNPQPLAHAQGEVAHGFLPRVLQPHQLQQVGKVLIRGQAQNLGLQFQIMDGGQVLIDGGGLHHRPHPPPDLLDGGVPKWGAVQGVVPGGGGLQPAEDTNQGGFSRPIPAHQAVNGPFGHLHGEVLQGVGVAVLFG